MPMKIKTITGHSADCEAGGLTQTVRIDFIEDAEPGITSWCMPVSPLKKCQKKKLAKTWNF